MSGGGFISGLELASIGQDYNSDIAQQWGFIELTKSASANVKSAWYLLGTIQQDCLALLLRCGYLNNSGSDHGVLHDIGIGASGSQNVVIGNIVQGQPAGAALTNFVVFQRVIPIAFAAGTQIWIRTAVNVASSTPHVGGWMSTIGSAMTQMQEFGPIDTIGQTATGVGTAATGGAGSKGSYVQLGTAQRDYAAAFLCFDFAAQSGTIRGLVDIAIGPASGGSQQVIMPNVLVGPGVGFSYMDTEVVQVEVPAGAAVYARFSNLDGSTNKIGVTFYGIGA